MSEPIIDRFADIKILRYEVSEFEQLPLQQKLFLYCLSEAALWGRDIIWEQNCAENLLVRDLLETVYASQCSANALDSKLLEYLKRVWFANGVHHHYSNDKFRPPFAETELRQWISDVPDDLFTSRLHDTKQNVADRVSAVIFDPDFKPKKVCLDKNQDLVKSSAVNFYSGVCQSEVESFYKNGKGRNALNSNAVRKADGSIGEEVWRLGGMYGAAIEKIVFWLERAKKHACNEQQKEVVDALIKYYKSGDLTDFDEYNKLWVAEKSSPVDFINGFIEVYNDPLGLKATWESIVELVDNEASERIRLISENAQWFEDHSPVDVRYRKRNVRGVSMKVINAVMLGGDCYPATPIGVNLPNADWIREQYGSKSVSLNNITHACSVAARDSGALAEFAASEVEIERSRKFADQADDLHTQLHECLGHGSGQMADGVTLDDLKAYGSTIEEARADLFALYFMADDKMIEIGAATSKDVAWAHYDSYMRNGLLVQMSRIELGKNLEEAHMRNRQLICRWVLQRAQPKHVAAIVERAGKHYVEIYDYEALRSLFGELLHEVQRIKSEGDYEAAKNLVENYGVCLDQTLHTEVVERYKRLDVAPFSGFVNPRLAPVERDGQIVDITIDYSESYVDQMLRYSRDYSVRNSL